MTNLELLGRIEASIDKRPQDVQAYGDYLGLLKPMAQEDFGGDKHPTYQYSGALRGKIIREMRSSSDADTIIQLNDVLKRTYLWEAQDLFHSYLVYLEWNRKPQERFYLPREKTLRPLIQAIQMLADGELDELFLSMPPRVGKTSMLMFLCTWLLGKDSEKSNLYSAYSDVITKAFYNGCLEILNDDTTYLWHDIFPFSRIVATNAQEETINIDRKKRYPSLTCRSLYGTLNGACDCNGFLISDDLIGGIEEALNKDRLLSAWSKVDNNLLPRQKQGAKTIWCGTRWSNIDPAGLRMDILKGDKRFAARRFKIINTPATNENGESNFDYDYGVGFDTEYYQQRKASFEARDDLASWFAQYQGEPVERTGVLFEPQDMKYYNGDLPDEDTLIRRFSAVDPAFGGGDYTAAPILYQYEDGSVFMKDVVFSNLDKRYTQAEIVRKAIENNIQFLQFECTKMTASYKEDVEAQLHKQGYRCNITYKPAPITTAKEVRIFQVAPEIREIYFLEPNKRSAEYQKFMDNLFAFKITGNNKHDDAPDSLAQAIEMVSGGLANVFVRKRKF